MTCWLHVITRRIVRAVITRSLKGLRGTIILKNNWRRRKNLKLLTGKVRLMKPMAMRKRNCVKTLR